MRVRLTGSQPAPEIIPMPPRATIDQEIEKRLENLSCRTPVLIQAQTGSGKTHAVTSTFIPWAKREGLSVLFVCPRLAPTIQAKRAFIRAIGETKLLKQLTDDGIRDLEEIGNVTVLTAQKLFYRMIEDPSLLKKFHVMIFDEIHLLLDDALFVSSTGYVLDCIRDHFGGCIRVYLSATPEEMIPLLAEMEAPYTLQVLTFPTNYGYIRPRFFQDVDELVARINLDKSQGKWLVYLPTIREGQQLKQQLTCSVRLLNRVEREDDQDGWNTILREERVEEKVCICTAVVDVGVNFKDKLLKNIVIFSTNMNKIVQFLGRKRYTAAETVNLFVWCPTQQELFAEKLRNEELTEAVDLYHRDYGRFVVQHVLPSQNRDLRSWLCANEKGHLELNPLVPVYLENQRRHLVKLLQRSRENKGDCRLDRDVAQRLHIRLPARSECWLDSKVCGTSKAKFDRFLTESIGKQMNSDEFEAFSDKFRKLCVAAYGTGKGGKDREDRKWGYRKVQNKLLELGNGYTLETDSTTKQISLKTVVAQSEE